jgi:hypothetical protein
MVKKMIVVKGVDEDVYLEFKAAAIRQKMTIGQTLNEAMKLWLNDAKKR